MLTLVDAGRTRIEVERVGGRDRVRMDAEGASGRPLIRPMLCPLPGSDLTRIALVPDGALLLAGDVVHLAVRIGAGAALEIVEPGGTVAYDMRGGRASWTVEIEIDDGGSLTWAGQQFVAAAGSDTVRRTTAALGRDARLALRETLVLGRHGEPAAGRLLSCTSVVVEGRPLLLDEVHLDLTPRSRLALGARRVIGSVLLAGARLPDDQGRPGMRFDLEGDGTLLRATTDAAHEIDAAWWPAAWDAVHGR